MSRLSKVSSMVAHGSSLSMSHWQKVAFGCVPGYVESATEPASYFTGYS